MTLAPRSPFASHLPAKCQKNNGCSAGYQMVRWISGVSVVCLMDNLGECKHSSYTVVHKWTVGNSDLCFDNLSRSCLQSKSDFVFSVDGIKHLRLIDWLIDWLIVTFTVISTKHTWRKACLATQIPWFGFPAGIAWKGWKVNIFMRNQIIRLHCIIIYWHTNLIGWSSSLKGAVSQFYHDCEGFKNTPRSYITHQKWLYLGKHHSTNNNPLGSGDG